ncbi:MAG TPA: NADH-quinone oxidoreductase subunit NuoG [Candidatus Sumerlaeota bacterium]|nr:NADH-quinone oxidoreductase subunit NuoG [Candidatus Sumerlaeota bacterium]
MSRVTIRVDGRIHAVKAGQNLLQAILSLGLRLPYFCWHPALNSVGACRQCAVKQFKDENDTRGRIVMACMTPVTEGMRVSVEDPEAKAFRKGVIEWLMLNHPHDCPVCDEGGACHLQDMTVMAEHSVRRSRFPKRTHRNQNLGPFLHHEMNRCIQCYRCVRFYRDYAGGRDFDVLGAHDRVYFGRHEEGTLESPFSGNLVEVCPTGVFTDKTFRKHYTRKWDLQFAPSVCPSCAVGCNTSPGERYGTVRCVLNRFNPDVNGYFLCDRGRFGYEQVNSDRRILKPLRRMEKKGTLVPVEAGTAFEGLPEGFSDPGRVIGIGSPRASLEANFALRTLVGPECFYAGVSSGEYRLTRTVLQIFREGTVRAPSVAEIEQCDAVVVLGEDLTNGAPRVALAVRQSVRNKPMERADRLAIPRWDDAAVRNCAQSEKKGPLLVATPSADSLDDLASWQYRAAPPDVARLGFALAHAVCPDAPAIADLSEGVQRLVDEVAQALVGSEKVAVLTGVGCGCEDVLRAAANLAWALKAREKDAYLYCALPERNSMGLALLEGQDLEAAFQLTGTSAPRTVLVLENDLFRRADVGTVTEFFDRVEHVVAIDCFETATTQQADRVLPSAPFTETAGTLVSAEGRAQRFFACLPPKEGVPDAWRWVRDMARCLGRSEILPWETLDDVIVSLAQALPAFEAVVRVAPPACFRINGQKIPRQPWRSSGRTALQAHRNLHEPAPPDDPDSPLAFSMEGCEGSVPDAVRPFSWTPGWNSASGSGGHTDDETNPEEASEVLLIGPGRDVVSPGRFFDLIPAAFERRPGEWLLVPSYRLFGSEELSALAPAIAERIEKPCLSLNTRDAEALGCGGGDEIRVTAGSRSFCLPLVIEPSLPAGVAGVPSGVSGLKWMALPQWGRIAPGGTK